MDICGLHNFNGAAATVVVDVVGVGVVVVVEIVYSRRLV